MWQDYGLSVIGLLFTIMLIPQLKDGYYGKAILNFWTCLITGLGCIGIGVIDVTLTLYYASIVSISTGIAWLLIMYYSEKNRKKILMRPSVYVNPKVLDVQACDQGERGTDVGMSIARAFDLRSEK
jgi:hypothetical protein